MRVDRVNHCTRLKLIQSCAFAYRNAAIASKCHAKLSSSSFPSTTCATKGTNVRYFNDPYPSHGKSYNTPGFVAIAVPTSTRSRAQTRARSRLSRLSPLATQPRPRERRAPRASVTPHARTHPVVHSHERINVRKMNESMDGWMDGWLRRASSRRVSRLASRVARRRDAPRSRRVRCTRFLCVARRRRTRRARARRRLTRRRRHARARDVGGARRRHAMVCLVGIGGWVYGYTQRGCVCVCTPDWRRGADEDANE